MPPLRDATKPFDVSNYKPVIGPPYLPLPDLSERIEIQPGEKVLMWPHLKRRRHPIKPTSPS